jgi:hypothetical protein
MLSPRAMTLILTYLQSLKGRAEKRRTRPLPITRPVLHFLHIGKTGGSAINYALAKVRATDICSIQMHGHATRLRDVPPGEKVIYFLRDPVTRFVSGFYSRKRRGQRNLIPWSAGETEAFSRFRTPNELACSLSCNDEEKRRAGFDAMKNISHVKSSYWDWFECETYYLSRLRDIWFIGFQERLDDNFETLRTKIRLPEAVQLPRDEILAHRNPGSSDLHLEETAVENIRQWYARDFEFVEFARANAGNRLL